MREFYFNLLTNLDKLAGLRQLEKIMAAGDKEGREEIKALLDTLCSVSAMFPYIPESDQKLIINASVLADSEFIGLNGRIIFKWLSGQKDRYFKQEAHKETDEQPAEPVTGEERNRWYQKWLESLGDGFKAVPTVSQAEMERERPRQKAAEYQKPDPDFYTKREQFIRDCQRIEVTKNHPDFTPEQIEEYIDKLNAKL